MPTDPIVLLTQEWERAKLGARDYIEAMPEDKISFRPVPEIFSFAGQFLHVADANFIFGAAACGTLNPHSGKSEEKPELQTKGALIEFATSSYDFIIDGIRSLPASKLDEEVEFFKWTMTRGLILSKALEHHAHHCGQTVIYFRLQGIKPPGERLF